MTLDIPISEVDLDKIKGQILDSRGFDLSYFKSTFLSRRINVRMKVLNISDGSEYAELLRDNSDEINSLYDSLSINVTRFFRDAQVWDKFSKSVIPKLLEKVQKGDSIRVWSSGCASGEEAYSLGIMFSEATNISNFSLKIVATDINSELLNQAKKGIYDFDTISNLDPKIISKYFTKLGNESYQIKKELRDKISFQVGDIVTFPVSYLDVVFCRNLLIYYGKDAQSLIFKKFFNVLKENRYLVLGMDEFMLGDKISRFFIPIHPREKIYQKRSNKDMLSSYISER